MSQRIRANRPTPYRSGFTIVELLIVIVVIAVLAAIAVVAYNGIQGRGRDAKRLSDMSAIMKALELYKADNGLYPNVGYSGLGSQAGWESSAREAPGEFLAPLKPYGFPSGVPTDPINNAIEDNNSTSRANGKYEYQYYKEAPGAYGCPVSRGAYYVLGVMRTDTYGNPAHPNSPGVECTNFNYQSYFSWVVGRFEN